MALLGLASGLVLPCALGQLAVQDLDEDLYHTPRLAHGHHADAGQPSGCATERGAQPLCFAVRLDAGA